MKVYIQLTLTLLMISQLISCEKDSTITPKLGLYKTSSDYFSYYPPVINEEGKVVATPYYTENDSRMVVTETDTFYSWRVRLENDFVLSGEVYLGIPFSDVTFKECYSKQSTDDPITSTILDQRIIDTDPFIEYYEVDESFVSQYFDLFRDGNNTPAEVKHLAYQRAAEDINALILGGQLSDTFVKLK